MFFLAFDVDFPYDGNSIFLTIAIIKHKDKTVGIPYQKNTRNIKFTTTLPSMVAGLFMTATLLTPAVAYDIKSTAKQGLVVDFETGTVLWEKQSDSRLYPASMTKIMTAYVVFEQLRSGIINLDDTFKISKKAWAKGGSKMFLRQGESVAVEDLLRGLIVQSGNDSAIALAEAISSTEENFAKLMNETAQKLGMVNSNFVNASGWPDENHYSTAHDLYLLSFYLIRDFPEYYGMFGEPEFTYAGITQANRNPMLAANIGADGLKTGHTEISGYGVVGSAVRDNRRVISIFHGMQSKGERARESIRLTRWGLENFGNYTLFQAGDVVDEASIWLGEDPTVSLYLKQGVKLTLPKRQQDGLKVTLKMREPLPAPIEKGQKMGEIVITMPGMDTVTRDVYAANEVEQLGPFGRLWAAFSTLLWGER